MKALISALWVSLALTVMSTGVSADGPKMHPSNIVTLKAVETPPKAFKSWAQWVEKKVHIRSKAGYGPKVGSREWMAAVDYRLQISEHGHGPKLGSKEWRRAVEGKVMAFSFMTAMHVPAKHTKDRGEWNKWVETKVGSSDKAGHGPDIGSREWMGTIDRKLNVSDKAGHGPDLGSDEWYSAVEKKLGR